MEDKDCFYSRLDIEQFRDDSNRKENIRRQKLVSLDWTSVMPGAHFFEGVQKGILLGVMRMKWYGFLAGSYHI